MNSTLNRPASEISKCVRIAADGVYLMADLQIPEEASALVIFAHDGRCRNHPRTRHTARVFRENGLGTLLCELLTEEEAGDDDASATYRNDAPLLARRLVAVTKWVTSEPDSKDLRIGYFGACAGGAAALIAAAKMPDVLAAVVSRDGNLDLATPSLPQVACPTLLIVGENDAEGIELNRNAFPLLNCEKDLQVVPGASHLFGEPGKLEAMASLSAEWLRRHLGSPAYHR